MKQIVCALLLACGPVFAKCPEAPDITDALDDLIAQARAAENDMEARLISGQMWELWLRAPDQAAQEVLDRGMRARSNSDFVTAIAAFDRLVEYCPNYAEGFNQRAFVNFLRGDYETAVLDLDRALALSPKHVGAQSGRALSLMNLGQLAKARAQLLEALENNPWLSERFLLGNGAALGPKGKDI